MMMRSLFAGFVFLWLAACVSGDYGIEVDPPKVDAGELWEGESLRVTAQVKNHTDKAVTLGKIMGGCNCVDTQISSVVIAPQDSARLDLRLLKSKPGDFKEVVLIRGTQEGGAPFLKEFTIAGTVRPAYTIAGMWQSSTGSHASMREFPRSETCNLPNIPMTVEPVLRVLIEGARPKDPFVGETPISVKSSLFTLREKLLRADTQGRMRCVLLLTSTEKLEQGIYPDRLLIQVGPDLKLSRQIFFRVIGPVWSEQATINFGAMGSGTTASRRITLHFESDQTVWSQTHVVKTDPPEYSKAISVTDVVRNGKDAQVALTLDSHVLSSAVKGYFHFRLFLGEGRVSARRRPIGEVDVVKLHVYGMVAGTAACPAKEQKDVVAKISDQVGRETATHF